MKQSQKHSLDNPKTQDIIRMALEKLERNGTLTPAAIVRAAKAPSHVLHRFFEWDDHKAAQFYRLEQARTLIRVVRVSVQIEDRIISTVRYVHDPRIPHDEQGFARVDRLADDPVAARKMVDHEFAQAEALLTRSQALATVVGVRREADRALTQVQRGRDKLKTFGTPAQA